MSTVHEWFYARGDQQDGPVSGAHLKQLAASGKLRPDDRIWREGLPDWVEARTIKSIWNGQPPGPEVERGPDIPEIPMAVSSSDRLSQMLIVAGLVGLLLLVVSAVLPWKFLSGVSALPGRLILLFSLVLAGFVTATIVLKEHREASFLAASSFATFSFLIFIKALVSELSERHRGSGDFPFGPLLGIFVALAVAGVFGSLSVLHPVEWASLKSKGMPPLLYRHGSLLAVQLVACLAGLVFLVASSLILLP